MISIIFGFILLLFVFSGKVNAANRIEKIEMDVYINSKGTAEVTEKWEVTLTKGTEGYKPYSNLENSEIINFSVTDDTGNKYTSLSKWNTNGSFGEKAYKCGINKTNKVIELCWGISQYGSRTYTLKYEITNFINQ